MISGAARVLLPASSTASSKPNLSQAVVATAQPPAELGEKWDAGNEAQTDEIRSTVMQVLADRTQGDVQPNMDPAANDVEVANRAWAEGKSPYIKVATITIPRQGDIDSAGQMNACENLSFDPWRGRPETRPLGQINRMRLAIYPAVASLRHDFNHVPAIEPRSHDICGVETASLCRAPKH